MTTGYIRISEAIVQVHDVWQIQENTLVVDSRIYVSKDGTIEIGAAALILGCIIVHEDKALNIVALGSDYPLQHCLIRQGDIAEDLEGESTRRIEALRLQTRV